MQIKISREEIQKTINLEPGWYKAKFLRMEAKAAAVKPGKNPSVNYSAYFEIEKDNREMSALWNSQLMGMMVKFVEVITDHKVAVDNKVVKEDIEFDPELNAGKGIQLKIEDEQYEGRLISKIKDFAPYDADMTAPF